MRPPASSPMRAIVPMRPGLNRGFTHYEDYVLERLGSLRTAGLVDAAVKTFGDLTVPFDHGWFHRVRAAVGRLVFRRRAQECAVDQSRLPALVCPAS